MIQKLILSILFWAALISTNAVCQRINGVITEQPQGKNLISCSEYAAITFNGHTIEQIRATDGEASQVKQLWGDYSSVDVVDIIGEYTYYYNTNMISFLESRLGRLEINDNTWPITVLGKTIRVGDSFSELQQKFGKDIITRHTPLISFNCEINEYDGLLIDLDQSKNEVTRIVYFVNP
ncbi:MAG: hypothetical protein ACQETE_07010 [Bacteroidota bacterium]